MSYKYICLVFCCMFLCLPCGAEKKDFYDLRDGKILHFVVPDALLGYRPVSSVAARTVKREDNGKIIYDAVCTTDAFGRRKTPVAPGAARSMFMLCFGCSFMFGEGVNDTETLPCYLAALMPAYLPYNYAYQGYGPQEMLAKLQSGTIAHEIKEARGMAIYLFMDNHINRAMGSMQVTGNWGYEMPYYAVKNGTLARKGNFMSGRHFRTSLYRKILQNKTLNRCINRRDFPPVRMDDVLLTCRIIEESRNEFRRQFNSDDFYVVLFKESPHNDAMTRYFRSKGIKYLDYHDRREFGSKEYAFPDWHPNARAYKLLATMIAGDLAQQGLSAHAQ